MRLVPASHFSIEQLTEAYNQTRIDYIVPMPMTARRLQEYVQVYDIDLDGSAVVLDGDEMLGLCMLGVRAERAWITRLGVLPTGRRRGVGQHLMEFCIEQAVLRQLRTVYLEVITGNEPAHRMFTKLGFIETRPLLILRRPPGAPPASSNPPISNATWYEEEPTIDLATDRPWLPAWTNQVESIINVGGMRSLHTTELATGLSGWVAYKQAALQLTRIIVSPDIGMETAPARTLLHQLHQHFSTLDSVAENVPADIPFLDAYFDLGYVESFSRIEMALDLTP